MAIPSGDRYVELIQVYQKSFDEYAQCIPSRPPISSEDIGGLDTVHCACGCYCGVFMWRNRVAIDTLN